MFSRSFTQRFFVLNLKYQDLVFVFCLSKQSRIFLVSVLDIICCNVLYLNLLLLNILMVKTATNVFCFTSIGCTWHTPLNNVETGG